MKENEALAVVGCVLVVLYIVSIPLVYVVEGLVLAQLWEWFMVPLFDAPSLTIPFAIGLALIVGYLTQDHSLKKQDGEGDKLGNVIKFGMVIGWAFLYPLIVLGIGWVVQLFIK